MSCRGTPHAFVLALGWTALASALFSQTPGDDLTFPVFVDVAAEVGLTRANLSGGSRKDFILATNGNGAGFFDYDNDGDPDLAIISGSTLEDLAQGGTPMVALYENDSTFRDVTSTAGLTTRGWGMGVCVADYDNDGNQDIYVTAYGPNVLYRNNGDGTFTDVTATAGVGDAGWGMNCAFADYDRDGDVDLYVANYLTFDTSSVPQRGETENCRYLGLAVFCGPRGLPGEPDTLFRNNGDGTFDDVTEAAGIVDPDGFGFGVVFTDLDGDLWPDIYVANDSVPNLMFHNNGDGTFSELGLLSGTSLSGLGNAQAGMGLAVDDYDGDGDFDIFVTNFIQDTNTLYENLGDLLFSDSTYAANFGEASLSHLGWGTGFEDLDNDGWSDLFVANGHVYPEIDAREINQSYRQPKEVYRNVNGARFDLIPPDLTGDLSIPQSSRGAAFGDYDSDGDIDILTVNIDALPSLYRNEGGNRQSWIAFQLEGTRSNRDGIGARIEVDAGGRTRVKEVRSGGSYLSHNDMRVHFGLASLTRIDGARVLWPDGTVDELGSLEANQFIRVREGEGVVEGQDPALD